MQFTAQNNNFVKLNVRYVFILATGIISIFSSVPLLLFNKHELTNARHINLRYFDPLVANNETQCTVLTSLIQDHPTLEEFFE